MYNRLRWRKTSAGVQVPVWQKSSSGRLTNYGYVYPTRELEIMRDGLHEKSLLGKTLNDIGGPLRHVKISLDLGDWNPSVLDPNYFQFEMQSLILPDLYNLGLGWEPGVVAAAAIDYLDSAEFLSPGQDIGSWVDNNNLGFMADNAMDSLGSIAINLCRPTTPAVDLATSVAELISERKFFGVPGRNGGVSGEYLNYQLAVAPLVGTFQDFHSAAEQEEELLAQYERDAGRLVRRRYTFPTETTTETKVVGATHLRSWDSGNLARQVWFSEKGTVSTVLTTTHDKWFSGAFTYAPPGEGWRGRLSELDSVYGIIPGVDTAWELVPFSFVADYFANMGDCLGNLASFMEDGLVMPFGYMMSRKTYDFNVSWTGPVSFGYRYPDHTLTARLKVVCNQRRPATPFGFGFSGSDLTDRQWSILAALGISAFKS